MGNVCQPFSLELPPTNEPLSKSFLVETKKPSSYKQKTPLGYDKGVSY